MKVALYRHYSANGELLYIGMSGDPERRMREHQCRTDWADGVGRSEIEWFPSRKAAREAESMEIERLSPPWNKLVEKENKSVKSSPPRTPGMSDSPAHILNSIGRERCALALGVSAARVERATRDGHLPAAWLDTLERIAGRPLLREAFAFKAVRKGAA